MIKNIIFDIGGIMFDDSTQNISNILNIDVIFVGLIVSAVIASLTVGGKAIGKKFAIKKCTEIIHFAGTIIYYVHPVREIKKG